MQALFEGDKGEGQVEPQAERSVYAMLGDAAVNSNSNNALSQGWRKAGKILID